jgi:hypothetical protein
MVLLYYHQHNKFARIFCVDICTIIPHSNTQQDANIKDDILKLDLNHVTTWYASHSQSSGLRPENACLKDRYLTYRLAGLLLMTVSDKENMS